MLRLFHPCPTIICEGGIWVQGVHGGEAYGIGDIRDIRADHVCEGCMSRWEGTSMASYRAVKTGAAPTASARGENGCPAARPDTAESCGGAMKRVALYARVSTDKQEREETIESQLDALYHAVEAG